MYSRVSLERWQGSYVLMSTGLRKMACWSVSMVHLPITLLGNLHILWQWRTFGSHGPFFLVAFNGNFTSGTAQSGNLTDVVQTTQVAIHLRQADRKSPMSWVTEISCLSSIILTQSTIGDGIFYVVLWCRCCSEDLWGLLLWHQAH